MISRSGVFTHVSRALAALMLSLPACARAVAHSTPAPAPFDRLGEADGLSNSHVNAILQDHEGYIWIATADGLNRFDGYDVTVFRHDPTDPASIRGNWVSGLHEDREHNLWVMFGIGGVDRFDRRRGTFDHVEPLQPGAESLPPDGPGVAAIAEDAHGRVWIGTQLGLSRLEKRDDGFGFIPFAPPDDGNGHGVSAITLGRDGRIWVATWSGTLYAIDAASLTPKTAPRLPHTAESQEHAVTMLADDAGLIWLGTTAGVVAFDPVTETYAALPAGSRTLADDEKVTCLAEDTAGRVWFTTQRGRIGRVDPERNVATLVPFPAAAATREGRAAGAILRDRHGRLWFSTTAGLLLWDAGTDEISDYVHDATDPESLPHNLISTLYEDRSGTLWVGTWGGGAAKLNERSLRFHRRRNSGADPAMPSARSINAVLVDRVDRLWLGTASGLFVSDPTHPEEDDRGPAAFRKTRARGTIHGLAEDSGGNLWIGHAGGLSVRRAAHSAEARYERPIAELRDVAVHVVRPDARGNMWIGTAAGLVRIGAGGDVHRYPVGRDRDDALPARRVSAILPDEPSIWIGTYIGGLSRLDLDTSTFEHFLFDEDGPATSSINSKSVTDIFEDSAGRLWIGTYSGGLNRFDRNERRFDHFTVANGLAGMRVSGILEGSDGDIWISTNEGLSRLDPEALMFKSYDVNDGLQANDFNVGARLCARDGRLYFGGVNGFNVFDSAEIVDNDVVPPIVITSVRVMDRAVPLASLAGESHDIVLPHDRNFIAFEFAALDFTNPRRNVYAHTLEGLDTGWIHSGTRRHAGYTGLDPGDYVFRVKGTNNDGVWNEAGVALSIRIVPPFWLTAWFRWSCGAAVVAAGLLAHRIVIRRRVAQSLALERVRVAEREHVREELSRDYHDELGARLSKISIFTELIHRRMNRRGAHDGAARIGDDELTRYVERVAQSAEVLSRETRDFIWALNPSKDSLLDVVHYLQEFGADLYRDTPVTFEVRGLSPELSNVRLDMRWKRQMTLIFKEAMTNCFTHSGAAHAILAIEVGDERLVITFSDDGGGIEAGARARSSMANGHGLDNMRARARDIDAAISFDSTPGGGTAVKLVAALPEGV